VPAGLRSRETVNMECERDRIAVLFTVSRVGLEKCAVTLEDARRFVREKLISYMKLVISSR
jgi:hypothetical protein